MTLLPRVCPAGEVRLWVWKPTPEFPSLLIPVEDGESPEVAAKRYLKAIHSNSKLEPLIAATRLDRDGDTPQVKSLISPSNHLAFPQGKFTPFVPSFTEEGLRSRKGPAIALGANMISDMLPGGDRREDFQRILEKYGADVYVLPIGFTYAVTGKNKKAEARSVVAKSLASVIGMGGEDITTKITGGDPARTKSTNEARDRLEYPTYRVYAQSSPGKLLMICRSMQGFCTFVEGHQPEWITDIPNELKTRVHQDNVYPIQVVDRDSFTYRVYGDEGLVYHNHHQGLRPWDGGDVHVVATTGKGAQEVVEAVESRDRRIIGTQFHPEELDGKPGREGSFLRLFVEDVSRSESQCIEALSKMRKANQNKTN